MSKPTLLAFHGSGSNSTIHTIQLARLTRLLRPHFDIESLCAPIECPAGPGILPFFEGCGPYFRWLPPSETLSASDVKELDMASVHMIPELEKLVKDEVEKAKNRGSKVVGVVGFSQGTRVVAGLLKAAQIRAALLKEGKGAELDWLEDLKFGLSTCSSFPPPVLPACAVEAVKSSGLPEEQQKAILAAKITPPTLHILGIQDEWRWGGKLLIEGAYEMDTDAQSAVDVGKSGLYEFNMGHHYPVDAEETKKVADWVLGTWETLKA